MLSKALLSIALFSAFSATGIPAALAEMSSDCAPTPALAPAEDLVRPSRRILLDGFIASLRDPRGVSVAEVRRTIAPSMNSEALDAARKYGLSEEDLSILFLYLADTYKLFNTVLRIEGQEAALVDSVKSGNLIQVGGSDQVKVMDYDKYDVRAYLPGGVHRDGFLAAIEVLQGALRKLPDYRGRVYRTTTVLSPAQLTRHQIGRFIRYSAFTSTTSGKKTFASASPNFIIRSRHGKDVRAFNPKEKEILFPARTCFKVNRLRGMPRKQRGYFQRPIIELSETEPGRCEERLPSQVSPPTHPSAGLSKPTH